MYIYNIDWPLLIICPSILKFSWCEEILRWIPSIKKSDIHLFRNGKEKFTDGHKIFILSYDLASRLSESIEKKNFQAVIADEAHYLKNKDAKRTKNLIPILIKAKRCILISGTPMLARPQEMFNILNILRPDAFRNFKAYADRYCDP